MGRDESTPSTRPVYRTPGTRETNYNRIDRYGREGVGNVTLTPESDHLQRVHRLEELVHPLDLAGLVHTRSR